jgi:hypothetical protein
MDDSRKDACPSDKAFVELRLPEDQIRALIDEGRWNQLADELIDWPEPWAVRLRRLARNVAALQEHQPRVAEALLATELPSEAESPLFGADADRTTLRSFTDYRDAWAGGSGIALLSIGDGSQLVVLARHAPELLHGRQQPIFVIEADAARLWPALAASDLRGAIKQPRIMWYVGPTWREQMLAQLCRESTLPFPLTQVFGTAEGTALGPDLERVLHGVAAVDVRNRSIISDYDQQIEPDAIAALLGPRPPRTPRVLLLTSRHTSVLQYSAKDSADAFEQLGWEVKLLIEPQPWHSAGRSAVLTAMASFKPDLVVQFDHLRHEVADNMPANTPWVCWVQDHLAQLTNSAAAQTVTDTEFVLTATPSVYVDRHGYPRESVIAVHKATRVPNRPQSWTSDGEDLVFVSTASRTGEQIAESNMAAFTGVEADCFRRAQIRVLRHYAEGGSLSTASQLAELLDAEIADTAIPRESREQMLRLMIHPLNDALYRQQALTWVVDIASELGLTVGLYGRGWEQSPAFAPHARGWVQYGEPLEALTRRSKINLQITPNACLHQRLLDGLVAGGFFLVRHHVTDDLFPELASFITEQLPDDVDRIDNARRTIAPAQRQAFDSLLARAQRDMSVLGEAVDPVAQIRAAIEARSFDDSGKLLPRLDEVSFDSKASLKGKIEYFLKHESVRREIAREQRESIEKRRTYVAAMRQVVGTIHERLSRRAEALRARRRSAA